MAIDHFRSSGAEVKNAWNFICFRYASSLSKGTLPVHVCVCVCVRARARVEVQENINLRRYVVLLSLLLISFVSSRTCVN
jgi:hypothetical protein